MPKTTYLCQTSYYYIENKKKSKLFSFNCFYTEYKNSGSPPCLVKISPSLLPPMSGMSQLDSPYHIL